MYNVHIRFTHKEQMYVCLIAYDEWMDEWMMPLHDGNNRRPFLENLTPTSASVPFLVVYVVFCLHSDAVLEVTRTPVYKRENAFSKMWLVQN